MLNVFGLKISSSEGIRERINQWAKNRRERLQHVN